MSRLIDVESLKDRMSECTMSNDEYERFCKIIDDEPTAYDFENVMAKLEVMQSLSEEAVEYEKRNGSTEDIYKAQVNHKDFNNLIEIVKKGWCLQ